MDCVSVVLQNSLVRNPVCYKHVIFLFKILGEHGQSFLSALSRLAGYVLLSVITSFTPQLCSVPFFLPFVQACRERIKGLQSKITAFSQRMNLINQRGTPDAEEMTI